MPFRTPLKLQLSYMLAWRDRLFASLETSEILAVGGRPLKATRFSLPVVRGHDERIPLQMRAARVEFGTSPFSALSIVPQCGRSFSDLKRRHRPRTLPEDDCRPTCLVRVFARVRPARFCKNTRIRRFPAAGSTGACEGRVRLGLGFSLIRGLVAERMSASEDH